MKHGRTLAEAKDESITERLHATDEHGQTHGLPPGKRTRRSTTTDSANMSTLTQSMMRKFTVSWSFIAAPSSLRRTRVTGPYRHVGIRLLR